MFRGKRRDQVTVRLRDRFQLNDQSIGASAQRLKSALDILRAAHIERAQRQPLGLCGRLKLLQLRPASRIAQVEQGRNSRTFRNQLRDELDPFGVELGLHAAKAGDVPSGPGEALDDQQRLCHTRHDDRDGARRVLCRE